MLFFMTIVFLQDAADSITVAPVAKKSPLWAFRQFRKKFLQLLHPEILPVCCRRYPDPFAEYLGKLKPIIESGTGCDLIDREIGVMQQYAGLINAFLLYIPLRRNTYLPCKQAGEGICYHLCFFGKGRI